MLQVCVARSGRPARVLAAPCCGAGSATSPSPGTQPEARAALAACQHGHPAAPGVLRHAAPGCQVRGGFPGTGSSQEPRSGCSSAGRAHYFAYGLRVLAFLLLKRVLPEWSESRQWCEPNHVREGGRRLARDKSRTRCLMVK